MAELDVVPKLATLVPHQNEVLETAVLRLLMNLSFEKRLRARMVEVGLLPKLAALLQKESVRACVCACVRVCVRVCDIMFKHRPPYWQRFLPHALSVEGLGALGGILRCLFVFRAHR